MAFKWADRVKETTQTTGTGSLDLDGAATGYRAFSDELSHADETVYLIVDDPDNPSEYEIGVGTLTTGSPDSLSRDTVLDSSNGGAKVNLQSGTTYTVIATIAVARLPKLTSDARIEDDQAPSNPTGVESVNGGPLAGYRNRVMNGQLNVWQRPSTSVSTGASLVYGPDRFRFNRVGGVGDGTISQQGAQGIRFCRIQRDSGTSGTGAFSVYHGIPTRDCSDLAGQEVTASVRIRVGADWAGGRFTLRVDESISTNEAILGTYGTSTAVVSNETASTSYQVFSGSVTLQSSTRTIRIRLVHEAFTGTAGANDYFDLDAVQLELGATAPEYFEHRPYADELAMCKAHYQLFGTGGQGFVEDADEVRLGHVFDVEMFATPTFAVETDPSILTPGGGSASASSAALSGGAINSKGIGGVRVSGFSGLTAGDDAIFTTSDWLSAEADL